MQPTEQTIKKEIVDVIVRDIVKARSAVIKVPSSLRADFARQVGLAGGAAGGISGAVIGAHLGLAGFFGAIPATWPLAIAALAVGGLAGSKLGERIKVSVSSDEGTETKQNFCPTCGLPR